MTQRYSSGMSSTVAPYRWSAEEFVRAWEAGGFSSRTELIEGEVWPVIIGGWHGRAVMRVARLLPAVEVEVSAATLPSGTSLPDPDCWVARAGARPTGLIGARAETWAPEDVLLLVEVSDETLMADLTTKARVYGSAGWPTYWVVSPEAVYVHTDPHPSGYGRRVEYRLGQQVPVPYTSDQIAVADLIG